MNAISLLNDAKYFEESNTRFAELRKLLDSKMPKDKLEAMKRLHAVSSGNLFSAQVVCMQMMAIGRDVSSFFPDVVKNVIVESQGDTSRRIRLAGPVSELPVLCFQR